MKYIRNFLLLSLSLFVTNYGFANSFDHSDQIIQELNALKNIIAASGNPAIIDLNSELETIQKAIDLQIPEYRIKSLLKDINTQIILLNDSTNVLKTKSSEKYKKALQNYELLKSSIKNLD